MAAAPAPISAAELEKALRERLEAIEVVVTDTSGGCGSKFEAIICSKRFEGVPLLDRHRMVNAALAEELKRIHAFSMKTWTPEQWAKNMPKPK